VPAAVVAALTDLRGEIEAKARALAAASERTAFPLPHQVVDGAQNAVRHRLDRLERRIVAVAKRHEQDTMRQVATARGALFPLGVRQERALNIIPILARHGGVVVDRMRDGARAHARTLLGSVENDVRPTERVPSPARSVRPSPIDDRIDR